MAQLQKLTDRDMDAIHDALGCTPSMARCKELAARYRVSASELKKLRHYYMLGYRRRERETAEKEARRQ